MSNKTSVEGVMLGKTIIKYESEFGLKLETRLQAKVLSLERL